ncbi:MAG: radical SAM protein [Polyangiaceae bacterium]|nr:radical SAM protein [Polyangiaceae bacterium]
MRVAFVWINWGGPLGMSQGVSILASELADAGHAVTVLHYHESLPGPQTPAECAAAIAAVGPDVALFSFGSNQAAVARSVVDLLKARCPSLPTLAGGVHCTLTPEEPLGWGSLDYVFVGEADGRMDGLVTRLARGEDIAGEPNIACRRQGFVKKSRVESLPDVTRQARPFWEGIDYRDLCIRMRGVVDVVAGRGCPYRCTYCHNAGLIELYRADLGVPMSKIGFTRTRDPHALLEECIHYRAICGEHLKMFSWGDDMAVMSKDFLRTWAEIYPREFPDLPFALNATLNFLDDEVVALLGRAGCNLVKFGLESGSARLRKFLRRPDYKPEVVSEALARLRRHGINTRAYVIVGVPTETEEEMLSTFKLGAALRIDSVRPSILFPYPGTPIYDYCQERDLVDHEVLGGVHNYYSRTVLRGFDARMHLLLGRIMDTYPMIMNAELGGEVGAAFAPLAQAVLHTPEERWLAGERERVLREQERLNVRFRDTHAEFYAVPFPERPDASFLMRARSRPLVNVDDAPNRDIDAS